MAVGTKRPAPKRARKDWGGTTNIAIAVHFTEAQFQAINTHADKNGISFTEAVRRMIFDRQAAAVGE